MSLRPCSNIIRLRYWRIASLTVAFCAIMGCNNNSSEPTESTVTPTTVLLPSSEEEQVSSPTDNPVQPTPIQPAVDENDDNSPPQPITDAEPDQQPSDEEPNDNVEQESPDADPVIEQEQTEQPNPDDSSVDNDDQQPSDQPDNDDSSDNSDDEPTNPTSDATDEPNTEVTPPPPELSPIDMLFEEIRLASGVKLLQVSDKLKSGQSLDETENDCLGAFDPALGEQPTMLDCSQRLIVGNSRLQLQSVAFDDTDACQQSLAESTISACRLMRASMLIPIEWVSSSDVEGAHYSDNIFSSKDDLFALQNAADLRIANIQPIEGISFMFDRIDTDVLTLASTSDVTGTFECRINISNAALLPSGNRGNCTTKIASALNRLYEMRPLTGVLPQ